MTAFGAGSLVGGLLSLRITPTRPLVAVQLSMLAAAPALAALSQTGLLPLLLVTTALAGAGFAAADTFWETTLQRETPQDRLGRVAAFDRLGSSALRPFGYLLAGSAAAAVGRNVTLLGASVLLALTVPAILAFVPRVRRLTNTPEALPAQPAEKTS